MNSVLANFVRTLILIGIGLFNCFTSQTSSLQTRAHNFNDFKLLELCFRRTTRVCDFFTPKFYNIYENNVAASLAKREARAVVHFTQGPGKTRTTQVWSPIRSRAREHRRRLGTTLKARRESTPARCARGV